MIKPHGERPTPARLACRQCGRRLRPHYEIAWESQRTTDAAGPQLRGTYHYTGKISGYGYRNDGLFCAGGCAYRYAVAAARQR